MFPIRKDNIIWRHEKGREEQILTAAERGEDIADQGTVILVVDGTMHQLNLIGGEIWRRCDGSHSLARIVEDLAQEYDVDPQELEEDVRGFIADLQQRGWLDHG